MANYNYVAPIQYKSYSDMNKERLAAKAVKDAAIIKQRTAGNTQRQKYLDQLSGLSTKGWSTIHRNEFTDYVKKAKREFKAYGGQSGYDPSPMINGLMRLQDIGNSHAELNKGRLEYEAHLGPNAKESKEDSWDAKFIYTAEGLVERDKTYNNVGLIGYNEETQLGYFPNPLYDPNAPSGTSESIKTLRDALLLDGATIDNNDSNSVIKDGKSIPVIGSGFDVPVGGFGGLWNADKKTRDTISPDNAFLNFKAQGEGVSIFKTVASEYSVGVKNGQYSEEEAHDLLKVDVLTYLTGQDPSTSLRASAIRMWEEKYDTSWENREDHAARRDAAQRSLSEAGVTIPPDFPTETPWEMYAEAVADKATLKAKPPGTDSSGARNTSGRLWDAISTNTYVGIEEASTGRVTQDVAVKNKQWKEMLARNLGEEFNETGNNIQTVMDNINNSEGNNFNVTIPEGGIKYDGQNINRITYYPEHDYVAIWRVDPEQGNQGPLDKTSAWAYTTPGMGDVRALAYQVIYKHQDGIPSEGAEITQQYRELKDNVAFKLQDGSGEQDPLQALFDRAKAGR